MYTYRRSSQAERGAIVRERVERGFPAHRPPHYADEAGAVLLTAACFEHRRLMSEPERRADVVDRIVDLADEFGFGLLGWVVLPNHYHALMTVPDTSSLSRLVGRLHGSTSRAWNIEDRADGRKCWYRYSDRTIRTDRHFYTALNYIHLNPVKHGVATTPFDWTASSIHWYTEHRGVAWLDDYFTTHPVRQMGTGWDEL